MSELSEDQIDRLDAAHAVFTREDGAARARLLAALAADAPPTDSTLRVSRKNAMKRYGSVAAIAASLLIAVSLAWQSSRPKNLFAQVVGAMKRTQGFQCDFTLVEPADAGAGKSMRIGRAYWSPSGAERFDSTPFMPGRDDGRETEGPASSTIYRSNQDGIELDHRAKQFRILPGSAAREYSLGLFGDLSRFQGEAEPISGPREIQGVQAEGFTVPWPDVVGDDTHAKATIQVWLAPKTKLPVRVDLVDLAPHGVVMRLEDFHWGPQDPTLFDASTPPGYIKAPTRVAEPEQIARDIADGLAIFAKYNDGTYPAVTYVYGDEQGEALRSLMEMPADVRGWARIEDPEQRKSREGEFAHGSYGLSWINVIQRDFPEGVYNGKTVTPADSAKILVRWRRDDGDYQVVFGDRSTAVVSATRLRELEAR